LGVAPISVSQSSRFQASKVLAVAAGMHGDYPRAWPPELAARHRDVLVRGIRGTPLADD
jgi:hypothetical protein